MGSLLTALERRTAAIAGRDATMMIGSLKVDLKNAGLVPEDAALPRSGTMLVARQIARMLDEQPRACTAMRSGSPVIVLRVPGASWADEVEATMSSVVARTYPPDPSERTIRRKQRGFYFEREADDGLPRLSGGADYLLALESGAPVIAIWSNSLKRLPEDLVAIASHSIELAPADVDALEWLVRVYTGEASVRLQLTQAEAATADPFRIAVAVQQRHTATEAVRRLGSLLRKPKTTSVIRLEDLHGVDEARAFGLALQRDVADYRAGRIGWDAVAAGCLFVGPPGVGKTTLAQALAATAETTLVATSVATWQSARYMSDTLKAIRSDFADAMGQAPAILFIDELDGIGRRDRFAGEFQDYWRNVTNCLIECLDGVGGRPGVIVVGACNSAENIDAAILRSGRLDRIIPIPLPCPEDLEKIVRHYLGDRLRDEPLENLVRVAVDATGADAKRWVADAERAARHAGRPMTMDDLARAVRGPVIGLPPALRHRVAVHESGHALLAFLHDNEARISVSVDRYGGGAGSTSIECAALGARSLPDPRHRLVELLAGRAAEELVFGTPGTGAGGGQESDLALATAYAASLECAFGLGGRLSWRAPPGHVMSLMADPDIAAATEAALQDAYGRALHTLRKHEATLRRLADLLFERGTANTEDIAAIVGTGRRRTRTKAAEA